MKALITGITGQDGSYLAEFLLNKNYEVHGTIRRSSNFSTHRIDHIYDRLHLHYSDLSDCSSIYNIIKTINPDEIYNLAAQSHVKVSFEQPLYTSNITGMGIVSILEAIKDMPHIKFYQASSSEMFGLVQQIPQSEKTPFYPRSPYGVSKVYSHWMTINYRESYGLHASCGILFNHESPRRGETFVTRKITRAATRIKIGLQNELLLGNLSAKRDWGFAKDYVEAMWMMLQQNKPDDFVIATGETHSVEEFCEKAFGILNLDYKDFIKVNSAYLRPSEVDLLIGDYAKAKNHLNWYPKTSFDDLVKIMIESDLELAQREKHNREFKYL